MPNYPLPPYPPPLDIDQYEPLWQVAMRGKILLIPHGYTPSQVVLDLVALGYMDATPRCRTAEARTRWEADLARCYDVLAAISREEWPARFEEAEGLIQTARQRRQDLVENDYGVSEAGYALVRAWEHGGRETWMRTHGWKEDDHEPAAADAT